MRKLKKEDKIEALATKFRDPEVFTFNTSAYMRAYAMSEIKRHGYTVGVKDKGDFKDTMTTTMPGIPSVSHRHLALAHNWNTKTDIQQALILAHELVHVYQDKMMGTATYATKYGTARGRWVLEVQAYAVSILAGRALGLSNEGYPERVGNSLWTKYKPWFFFSEKEIVNSTIETLSQV